jgi:hypothetical protein
LRYNDKEQKLFFYQYHISVPEKDFFIQFPFIINSNGLGGENMNSQTITFHNVSPAAFKCMKKKLEDSSIHVPPGNKGELSGQGIVADFEWDGQSKLIITIKKKPFIVTYEIVASRIRDFVKQCHGSPDKTL